MSYDLCVFWVEDTVSWCDSQKGLMDIQLSDIGISIEYVCEEDAEQAKKEFERSCAGFRKYDLFFIDYNISSDIDGKDIIRKLRSNNVDADILFYSAFKEKEISETVKNNLSEYEGVYIANRDNFLTKAMMLINKNAHRLLSIFGIRGKLMDCTSENDFIINSFILEKYPGLPDDIKEKIEENVCAYLEEKVLPNSPRITERVNSIKEKGIGNIKGFMKEASYIVPLELKYKIFVWIQQVIEENGGDKYKGYFDSIVPKRNTLAHKKLDICDEATHIKYCDTLEQYKQRQCDHNCSFCKDENSISLEEWGILRKEANEYSKIFGEVLSDLKE